MMNSIQRMKVAKRQLICGKLGTKVSLGSFDLKYEVKKTANINLTLYSQSAIPKSSEYPISSDGVYFCIHVLKFENFLNPTICNQRFQKPTHAKSQESRM